MKTYLGNLGLFGKQAGYRCALRCSLIVSLLTIFLTAAIPQEAIADTEQVANDAVRSFWSKCQPDMNSTTADSFVRIRYFGQDARVADLLVNLIAVGEKTGTFTSPWIFEGNRNETPVLGGYTVVTDIAGNPRLLLRTTAVRTMRFDEISEAETLVDGPAVRMLDVWRQVHWAYFERELASLNRTPSTDMPVTVEEFEVVCDSDKTVCRWRMMRFAASGVNANQT